MVFKGVSNNGGSGNGSVVSVTGLNTNNTDPNNPVVAISVDGITVTGAGTPGSPLVSVGGGGGGSVTSVRNTDGTIAITPTAGLVVVNLVSVSSANILIGNVSGVATGRPIAGDVTLTANGTVTLATVNSNVGTFGSSTAIPSVTFNGKGLATAASTFPVVAPAGTLTGTTVGSTVVTSSLTTVGTLTGGGTGAGFTLALGTSTLSGVVPVVNGGSGVATLSAHGLLVGEGTGNVAVINTGTAGQLVIDQGSGVDPAFKVMVGDMTLTANGTATLAAVNSNVGAFTAANITVNAKGLITAAASGGNAGTVTRVSTGQGLTGGTITSAGTVSISTNTINTLAGWNANGDFSNVTIGANLTLSGGSLAATGGGSGISLGLGYAIASGNFVFN